MIVPARSPSLFLSLHARTAAPALSPSLHPAPRSPQVFVANPNKTQPIVNILAGNKEKLLKYLTDFHADKSAPLCP